MASSAETLAGFTNQQFEFIELLNSSGSVIDLSGCRFALGIAFDFLPTGNWTLAPGARLVLAANAAAFATRYPASPAAGTFAEGTNLSNGGERLTLLDATSVPIFDFVFNDDPPWPGAADGNGYSIVLRNAETHPDPAVAHNWRASLNLGGTPGGTDADSFAAWSARSGISGGALDDDNANGVLNLVEYALGLRLGPVPSGGLFSVRFEVLEPGAGSSRHAVVQYQTRLAADDAGIYPEMSPDLLNWIPLTEPVPASFVTQDGIATHARRSTSPVALNSPCYFRLRINSQE